MRTVPANKTFGAIRVVAILASVEAVFGFLLAGNQYVNMGPNINQVLPQIVSILHGSDHPTVAADDVNVAQYYIAKLAPNAALYAIGPNPQWAKADPAEILTYGSVTGDNAWRGALDHGYFTAVVLSHFGLWTLPDRKIDVDLRASGRYKLAVSVPYTMDKRSFDYQVWVAK